MTPIWVQYLITAALLAAGLFGFWVGLILEDGIILTIMLGWMALAIWLSVTVY
jgi:hypothetical protein